MPWLVVLGVARVVIDHWLEIDKRDRRRARQALTRSRLRPGRLTPQDREDLRRIAGQVQKRRLAYEATSAAFGSMGAGAVGALAVGAVAFGALAVGALSVGRLAVGRGKIRRLEIEELHVQRLTVDELSTPDRKP